ncbi:MAG: RidA family protein [Clostridiales bacterium]|nr:RidA family protein [Clostridiales bacterium]
MKEIIFTKNATSPTAPYSQGVKTGGYVALAGVCGDDPVTGEIMGGGDMKIEAKYALDNLKATIEAAGGCMNDIVKVRVFVNDIDKMDDFNSVYTNYFENGYLPARIAMEIVKLAGGANLEIEAEAIIE